MPPRARAPDVRAGRLPAVLVAVVLASATPLLLGCPGGPETGARAATDGPGGDAVVRRQPGLDVLLITVDTLRADALGSSGNAAASTPVLDRLAAAGVRFSEARAHNVVTLPSHATLLSGRGPREHGVRDNSGFRMPASEETLATVLSARGYRTGAFVSAFPLDSRFGLDRGFDVYDDAFAEASARPAFVEQERAGRETVAAALRWLAAGERESPARPSFAWVHLYEPHDPYQPPPPFDRGRGSDPESLYAGEVAAADAALEPLLAPILDAGPDGDTLVVVTSDHGESLGEHGEATHGIFAYDATLRVPLIVYQPRLLAPRVVDAPVGLVDVAPTVLDLLGEEPLAAASGRSLAALAAGVETAGDSGARGVEFEALSGQLNRGWAPLVGIVSGGHKYVRLPIAELYDLRSDPNELRNLAADRPEQLERLAAELDARLAASPGAEPDARVEEDGETRRRLQALGYLPGAAGERRDTYTEADDPKNLIALDARLREVVGLHAAGRLREAREGCREILEQRPDMRVALMTLAQIERDLGDLDAAAAAMRRAWELHPGDTVALATLVSYLTQAGRPAEAVAVSAAHAESVRPDVEVLSLRALALARSGRAAEAARAIEQARALDPSSPLVAVYAGTLALMDGRRPEARAAFERAVALDQSNVRAHTALAVLATEEGRLDDAVAHWRRSVELDPREHAKLLGLAGSLWQAGETRLAAPLLRLFLEQAPPERFGEEIATVKRMLGEPGRVGS